MTNPGAVWDATTKHALSHHKHDWNEKLQQGPLDLGFKKSYITVGGIQQPPYAFLRNDKFQKKDLGDNTKYWQRGIHSMPEGMSKINTAGDGAPDWDSTAYNMILVDETEKYLKRHMKMKPDQPFFTYVALGSVHVPHSPPDKYLDGSSIAGTYDNGHKDLLYEMDKVVGSLIQILEDEQLIEDTIIIFTSDNGGLGNERGVMGSNGPLRGKKGSIYEGGHRIPMTIRWGNGIIPKGETRSHIVGLNDVFATLCDLSGIKVPTSQAIDSVSFADYAMDATYQDGLREYLGVWRFKSNLGKAGGNTIAYSSIRKGNMKLVHKYKTNITELFDLSKDLSETNDISQKNHNLALQMFAQLRKIGPCYDNMKRKADVYFPRSNITMKKGCTWFGKDRKRRCKWKHQGLSHCGVTCKGERSCEGFSDDQLGIHKYHVL